MKDNDQANCFNVIVEKMIGGRVEKDDCRQGFDADFQETIELAQKLLQVDYSPESPIRNKLRFRLSKKFGKLNPVQGWEPGTAEFAEPGSHQLDDYELAAVAGGVNKGLDRTGCSFCACTQTAGAIKGENCAVCGHPRCEHSG